MQKFFFILTLSFFFGCQSYNSNTSDSTKYGPIVLDASDPNFAKAFNIISVNCISCHTGDHNSWASYTSNQKWVDNGYIVQGSPTASLLVQRIINTGLSESDMPQGGSALSASDYQAVLDWITNMPP